MIESVAEQPMPAAPGTGATEPGFRIGTRAIPTRYCLSPLAGYTHLAFRLAVRELGGLGLATTDLVHATHLVSRKQCRASRDLVATAPADQPLSVQIFGGKTEDLVKAARWLEAHGYEGIDINMGCPMGKVNGQGGGARLLCDRDRACGMVAAVVEAVSLPVTVKMRLGWDRDSITAPELARAFEQVGVAAITIHGRTRQQGFGGSVDRSGIRAVVEAVARIPVIGNGDVRTASEAFSMRAETGCAAVAIGRGAMLDPWIFRRIAHAERGGTAAPDPTPDERVRFLVRHFDLMTEQHGDYSCRLFRKFAAWYGAVLGIPEDLEDRLRRFESIAEFHGLAQSLRDRIDTRSTRTATALVRVPNGPVERW